MGSVTRNLECSKTFFFFFFFLLILTFLCHPGSAETRRGSDSVYNINALSHASTTAEEDDTAADVAAGDGGDDDSDEGDDTRCPSDQDRELLWVSVEVLLCLLVDVSVLIARAVLHCGMQGYRVMTAEECPVPTASVLFVFTLFEYNPRTST